MNQAGAGEHINRKGLSTGAVGLLGATIIGVSCVAPAYTLTAALGPIVSVVGVQTPAIILIGFVPMLLVALGYRELNHAVPDNGTSFTWTAIAFGPWAGWLAGWGLISSTVLVLSNSAGVAVDFLYLALSQATYRPDIAALAADPLINIATCMGLMGLACFVSYRGMEATKLVQSILVAAQVLVLAAFAIAAMTAAETGAAPGPLPVRADWFDPFAVPSAAAVAAGLSLSIFIFWGWDVTLTMNEETKGARSTPGLAAAITVAVAMLLYMLAATASLNFSGIGSGPLGLGNQEVQRNVFLALSEPVFGPFAIFMSLAVLCSSAAALQSTMVSPSRTMLAMSYYGALPAIFRRVSSRFHTPHIAIMASTLVSSLFYAVMRIASEHVLWDTITALGIMICFYYSMTAFSVVWYFRGAWFGSAAHCFNRLLCPLIGGLMLLALFFKTLVDSLDPGFGSGSHLGQIGLVFIIGMTIFAVGIAVMIGMAVVRPDYFRGRTLARSRLLAPAGGVAPAPIEGGQDAARGA